MGWSELKQDGFPEFFGLEKIIMAAPEEADDLQCSLFSD